LNNYKEVVVFDPFMRPYWRHERGLRIVQSGGSKRITRHDDEYIGAYRDFLVQWKKPNTDQRKLMVDNPGLYYANSIHNRMQTDPEVGLTIEARLLAGFSAAQIAAAYKTLPETIEWYERIFFNVQPFITHKDWIVRNVLVPASDSFALQTTPRQNADTEAATRAVQPIIVPYFDMSLKLFAYFGGPAVCDMMISGFQDRKHVHKPEELNDYLDNQFSLQIKRRSLQASTRFDVTKYNVMELFVLNSKLIEIQRSSINQDDKHTAVEKNIHAMMNDFDWRVGLDGVKAYEGTELGNLDKGKAELDPEELLFLKTGAKPNLLGLNEKPIFRTELVSNAKS